MKNLNKTITVMALSMSAALWAQADAGGGREAVLGYIDRFESIAISEMERTGIPASIKLAQGILESDAGRSYLALEGNNHFGIKCGGSWKGGKVYRKDDDYDRNGRLRHSCFRSYESPEESYVAHSNFLADFNKAHRYGFLFDLDPTDYKAWARGLKKAGYATNPRYAHLLINIIESYGLDKYDKMQGLAKSDVNIIQEENQKRETEQGKKTISSKSDKKFFAGKSDAYRIRNHNGVDYVEAQDGDQLYVVAMDLGIDVDELIVYNDRAYGRAEYLNRGNRIYIERKSSRFKGSARIHRVGVGERMEDIAQIYGIRVEKLYKRNRMRAGAQPAEGEMIYLNSRRPKRDPVLLYRPELPKEPVEVNKVNDLEPVTSEMQPLDKSTDTIITTLDTIPPIPQDIPPQVDKLDPPTVRQEDMDTMAADEGIKRIHVVGRGETLYRIAKLYDTTVSQLKAINKLESDNLLVGQELVIE